MSTHFSCSTTSYLLIYAKNRQLKILHLNGILANVCCVITCNFFLLLPEPVTNMKLNRVDKRREIDFHLFIT